MFPSRLGTQSLGTHCRPKPAIMGNPKMLLGGLPVVTVPMLWFPIHGGSKRCRHTMISVKGSTSFFMMGMSVMRMFDSISCGDMPGIGFNKMMIMR